jgi:ABC-type sugar transport system ATPase subunit
VKVNHADFYEWLRNHPQRVYISSYAMPEDFKCVAEWEHRSTLSGANNDKAVIEKLFVNK